MGQHSEQKQRSAVRQKTDLSLDAEHEDHETATWPGTIISAIETGSIGRNSNAHENHDKMQKPICCVIKCRVYHRDARLVSAVLEELEQQNKQVDNSEAAVILHDLCRMCNLFHIQFL